MPIGHDDRSSARSPSRGPTSFSPPCLPSRPLTSRPRRATVPDYQYTPEIGCETMGSCNHQCRCDSCLALHIPRDVESMLTEHVTSLNAVITNLQLAKHNIDKIQSLIRRLAHVSHHIHASSNVSLVPRYSQPSNSSRQAAPQITSYLPSDTKTHATIGQEELEEICSSTSANAIELETQFTTSDSMSQRNCSAHENRQNTINEVFRTLTTFRSSRLFQIQRPECGSQEPTFQARPTEPEFPFRKSPLLPTPPSNTPEPVRHHGYYGWPSQNFAFPPLDEWTLEPPTTHPPRPPIPDELHHNEKKVQEGGFNDQSGSNSPWNTSASPSLSTFTLGTDDERTLLPQTLNRVNAQSTQLPGSSSLTIPSSAQVQPAMLASIPPFLRSTHFSQDNAMLPHSSSQNSSTSVTQSEASVARLEHSSSGARRTYNASSAEGDADDEASSEGSVTMGSSEEFTVRD